MTPRCLYTALVVIWEVSSEGFAKARDDYVKKNPHHLINKKGEENVVQTTD